MRISLRTRLIIVSLIFLAVPSLLIGIIGYKSAVTSLNTLGSEGLKTEVRMTIEMINALNNQVKAGKISLAEAQEEVKEAILGKKDADGQRPINSRLNLGDHGFIFIINEKGVEIAHPNFEGKNVWDVKTSDGVYSTKEVVKAANNGGGFATYKWPLPDNPDVDVTKITYAEKEPNWDWIVCAGSYLPDFNAGADRVLYILLITLGISLLAGIMVILIFAKRITNPILQVAEQAEVIAQGGYTHEPIKITRKDEIGELVLNFNIMKENQKQAEKRIRQNEAFLQSITNNMGEGMFVINTAGELTFINRQAEQMLGWSVEECASRNFHDMVHRKENGSLFSFGECPGTKAVEKGKVYRSAEEWFMRKNGSLFPVSYVSSPLFEGDQLTGTIVVFRDISKKKEAQKRIEYMAFHDDLTKLPNLRLIKEKLSQEIESGQPFALLVLDIDRFKQINEALGHSFGDLMLTSIAKRLTEHFPSDVFVGRLTGDEFAVIYPGLTEEDEWALICKQIQEKVNEPLQVEHHRLNVSVTIGSALYPQHGNEGEEFLKHANIALMEAQEQQVPFQMYQSSMSGQAFERLVLENHLRHALQKNQFRLVYQPQVDVVTGQIIGVEALIRWNHPMYGFISPDQFIPIAEKTGLIIPIGEWVLRTSCRQLKEWHNQGLTSLCMAVNLSSRQFYSQDLIETIKGILHETGLTPESIELEITESTMMNFEHVTQTLQDLKQLGCHIAIDDFGTGYSSLNYLKHLPIDRLKIDQSFIKDLKGNDQDDAIVSTIISMAQHLQLDIIAEGVETPEQQHILRKKQCTHVQGYLYSPPLAPEEFLQQWEHLLQKAKAFS